MPDNRDTINLSFELVAEHYSGRIAYLPDFFARAVELFGVSKSGTVVDLGCGTGVLSQGFAPHCKCVVAVDKSDSMMKHRVGTPDNVRFVLADVNAEDTMLPVSADLVVIGRAVHLSSRKKDFYDSWMP